MLKTIATLALLATTITPALSEEIRGEATFAWLAVGSTFTLGDGRPYFAGQFSGINVFKDFGAGIRNIVGGRSKSYEDELTVARENALAEMQDHASAKGANAMRATK